MKVTQCDRCKRIVEESTRVEIHDSQRSVQIAREYDLCDRCREALERFVDGEMLDDEGGSENE